jgi:glutamate-1-semialdehyde aminotransferase
VAGLHRRADSDKTNFRFSFNTQARRLQAAVIFFATLSSAGTILMTAHLMNTYGRLPVAFARGEGVWLWDTEGKRYLDGFSGIAVTGLGHAHPRLVQAIAEQAGRIIHASNWYRIPEQERLADLLCELSGMDNVFFSNSGCEANEAAIKLARLYGHQKGVDQPTIVVMEKAFHGRTMATLSATGNRKVQAGFEPLLSGFARVPYNDVQALEQVALNNKSVVAVLVEPIQGEGGINVPDNGYLPSLRKVCDRQGWLLMLDEVQSGIGRTGRWFAHQLLGIKPDVMTLAKGLANGVPIGACLAHGPAAQVFKPGTHLRRQSARDSRCVHNVAYHRRRQFDGECGTHRRSHPPRLARAVGQSARSQGDPRQRADGRHRARPAVQRLDSGGSRPRTAHQRDGRHRRAAAAAAHHGACRSTTAGRRRGSTDPRISRGAGRGRGARLARA